jgi:hypothetical protein
MLVDSRAVLACLLSLVLSAAGFAQDSADRKPLFGELHIHTGWSFDAYVFGVRATPDDAYEFAKGKPLKHPLGKTYQLSRPLDFMGVTDHGIFMGAFAKMADPSHPLSKHPFAAKVNDPDPTVASSVFAEMVEIGRTGVGMRDLLPLANPQVLKEAWAKTIDAANRHNNPGTFTALIGYEWTSGPDGQNLHRNVFFKGDTAPAPFTRLQSQDPAKLWDWMDKVRGEGHEVLAIPHNSNLSDGRMFRRETEDGNPFTAAYADQRNRNEPLVEVTQVKGTSETHPMLSPNDEFADFELVEQYVGLSRPVTNFHGSYVRDAYRTGLEFQDAEGFNPYRFGLVGATDSHTGIVPAEENDYSGKVGTADGSPEMRLQSDTIFGMDVIKFGASGLTGLWADENTRAGIFETMARKETWGTTGPRIRVRFFGGFDMQWVVPGSKGWVEAAYAAGVSMGGALNAMDSSGGEAPTFAVWAMKDPESANLDRIQIVKVWSQSGTSHEQVYDVVWSDDRKVDPKTGKLEAVGNTVNLETLAYENSIGSVELQGTWTDPGFNREHNAAYYARVIEIPTPRWSMFDAKDLRIEHPAKLPETIQERAYTSPIFYDHH